VTVTVKIQYKIRSTVHNKE